MKDDRNLLTLVLCLLFLFLGLPLMAFLLNGFYGMPINCSDMIAGEVMHIQETTGADNAIVFSVTIKYIQAGDIALKPFDLSVTEFFFQDYQIGQPVLMVNFRNKVTGFSTYAPVTSREANHCNIEMLFVDQTQWLLMEVNP